ncbi:MAG: sigma 54-interacting transcriptional regulator [Sandaracinaceae bacterium]
MDPGAEFESEEATTRVASRHIARVPVTLRWTDDEGVRDHRVDGDAELGSAPGLTLSVAHRTVSRLHARIEHRADGPWVVDLGSTNGTRVDGLRVTSARLPAQAVLQLGEAEVHVVCAAPEQVAVWDRDSFGPMVGTSGAMRALFQLLSQYAATDATVLVTGETGTGKDVAARAVHAASARAGRAFVVVDCGAIPEALVESELFGHARGAFSGADRHHEGSFGAADGGTLFLDEVGELPLSVQPKLLRALESGTVRRVGEAHHREVDVRVVAATHRDLAQMVTAGAFREDLYFRLAVLPVSIPPLRSRPEDIPGLLAHFQKGTAYAADTMAAVLSRPWLGNARELRNFVQRADAIGPEAALRSMPGPPASRRLPGVDLDEPFKVARDRVLAHLERNYLEGLLARNHWNVSAVAEAMSLDRSYVHRLIKKHGLSRNEP